MSRLSALPREILYFAGIGAYGLGIGIVYWFLTYETAGSVLLTVFGAGAVGFAVILGLSRPARAVAVMPADAADAAGAATTDSPFGSEPGRIPGPTLAPLEVGFGIAVASLSFAFGVWMLLAGIVPIVAGVYAWLRSSERELIATRRDDPADMGGPTDVSAPSRSEESPSA
jgi:hypothetical protein